jgi:ribulose-5-phosphate 4-epimerase/fuculose-1-phosphate aldolase
VSDDIRSAVVRAARVLAAEALVDAFGHMSARLDAMSYAITLPRPLGTVGSAGDLVVVDIDSAPPAAAPREAWLHTMAYRRRADVRAIARAQPPSAFAAGALPGAWRPAHGHGALLGPAIPVHDDPRLARDRDTADAIIATLGRGRAVVLRGNGALTVAPEGVGEAVAAMWVVEAAARIRLALAAAPDATVFTEAEVQAWQSAAPELLGRIWSFLVGRRPV